MLVEDRRRDIARDLAFARRTGLRRSAAAFVLALGSGISAFGAVLDEDRVSPEAVYSARQRAR